MGKAKIDTPYSWLGNTKNIYSQEDIVYSPFLYGVKRIGTFDIKPGEEYRLISYPSHYFIVFVNKGTLKFRQDDFEVTLEEGEILFRDGELSTHWTCATDESASCCYFLIKGINISHFYSEYERNNILKLDLTDEMHNIINQILIEAKKPKVNIKTLSVNIYSLLLEIINPFEIDKKKITQKAIEFIEKEYQNDQLSIQDLANSLHISYHYFCHIFKQENLVSPQRFIAKYRLNKALQLLKNSNLSIEDIYLNVGFKNKQAFIKECKEETGLLPFEYRNANRPASLGARQTKKIIFTNVSNIGDPFMIVEGKKYYMFATMRNGGNFGVYVSEDMKYYKYLGTALDKSKSFGNIDFWSPEVIKYNDVFYLFYSARDKNGVIHINVAKSSSIAGPYADISIDKPLLNLDTDTLEAHPFIDKDGKIYLFFVLGCATNIVEGKHMSEICVVELKKNFSGTIGDIHKLIRPTEKWEMLSNDKYYRNDAPGVFYHDGTYFLTYSANNFRDVNYCSGVAKSNSVLGPYIKEKSGPIVKRIEGVISSPGHFSFFYDLKGNLKCVYHILTKIKQATSDRRACISSVYIEGNKIIIDYK